MRSIYTFRASKYPHCSMTTEEMIKLLQDDFVEATELDVMRAALKWAEQVARDKEPDLIRKRRKEPSSDLVQNALAPLLPYIRLEHVLPTNCPHLTKIFQSGLIRNPPKSIDGQSTIGKGWEYGDARCPRFFQTRMSNTSKVYPFRETEFF